MFKVGDRVKILSLEEIDIKGTNLKVGQLGTVTKVEVDNRTVLVDFGDSLTVNSSEFDCPIYELGYRMWNTQVELVECPVTTQDGMGGGALNGEVYVGQIESVSIRKFDFGNEYTKDIKSEVTFHTKGGNFCVSVGGDITGELSKALIELLTGKVS